MTRWRVLVSLAPAASAADSGRIQPSRSADAGFYASADLRDAIDPRPLERYLHGVVGSSDRKNAGRIGR